MVSYLEAWEPGGARLVALEGDRVTVGRAEGCNLVLSDRRISGLHAILERLGDSWCVRDLGSRNGTFLNGERVVTERVLRPGDELRLGQTRVLYRAEATRDRTATEGAAAPPRLTTREHDVLVALCRPVAAGSLLTEPASVAEIAGELVVTESAVKKHLANLYDKFGLYDERERRRGRLANEAISRGAVSLAELRRT